MRRITPHISLNLSPNDLDLIEIRAAQLLEQVGIEVDIPEVRLQLAEHPAVSLQDRRVCFDSRFILEICRSKHAPPPLPGSHLSVSAGGGALSLLDHRNGELRPPTGADLLQILRIADRLGLGGDPPVIPIDIPEPLREIALYRATWENTMSFTGRDITSIQSGEVIFEMAQVVGKSVNIPLYLINPLRVNPENLRLILHFADRMPSLSTSGMPMPGATAPLFAPGYLVQLLAEMIGGYTILSILFPQKNITFGGKLLAFSPYSGSIACGSPEALLMGQMEIALLSRYGLQPGHFFWSMAGGCDLQAASERMAGVLMGALAGVRSFGVAGRLQGEAYSLEMLLVDLEIAAYVERVIQGQAWDEQDSTWLTEIQEAILAGTFLGNPSTTGFYRQEIQKPGFFTRQTLPQRSSMGEKSLQERIRERLRSLDSPPPPEYLSQEVRAELARLYRFTADHLASGAQK
jgi:trimethylamine--corrinoid protein Co-methyltransferase